jgi:hypothetical protein
MQKEHQNVWVYFVDPRKKREELNLVIQTSDGKVLEFQLLDGRFVDMANGHKYVYGKVYDIFA